MEKTLNSQAKSMLPYDFTPPSYDHIILTDEEMREAVRIAIHKKAYRIGKPKIFITLTDAEMEEAYRLGRAKKQGQMTEAEYFVKLQQPPAKPRYTAEEMVKIIIEKATQRIRILTGKKDAEYQITQYNRVILWQLALYFTDDIRFEKQDLNLQKGICLVGPVGCGKTLLMNLFQNNQKQSYRIVGCQAVGYQFAKDGFDVIMQHSRTITDTENQYGHTEFGTCFDDLGADEARKYYGDRANALGEVIETRYRSGRYPMTHLTTNLDGEGIEEYYGLRVRSRIREMFNILFFDSKAPDLRK